MTSVANTNKKNIFKYVSFVIFDADKNLGKVVNKNPKKAGVKNKNIKEKEWNKVVSTFNNNTPLNDNINKSIKIIAFINAKAKNTWWTCEKK